MKLSIVCSRFPYPIEKGDKLRLYHQIKDLSQDFDIQLISLSSTEVSQADKEELLQYCSEIKIIKLNKYKQALSLLYNIVSELPFQVAYFYDFWQKKTIQSTILQFKPDILYTQLIRSTEYVKAMPIPKVIDYMDAFSLNYERRVKGKVGIMKALYKEEVKRLKNYEKQVYKYFDGHSIISTLDRSALKIEARDNIEIVRNGVDYQYFQPRKTKKEFALVFVGNMGYEPNDTAARFILNKIYPEISKIYPEIKILIAGARPSKSLKAYENDFIKISGWMDDIRKAYNQGMIFIAPLFSGSGLQNKILEAMSMKLPIITTPIVNGSIGIANSDFIEASDIEDFVRAIDRLLKDENLRYKMGEKGREFIKRNYSWSSSNENLKFLLTDLYKKA